MGSTAALRVRRRSSGWKRNRDSADLDDPDPTAECICVLGLMWDQGARPGETIQLCQGTVTLCIQTLVIV